MLSIPIGKAIMKNRQPMKLRGFAAVHNAFLFGLSLYMCLECIQQVGPKALWFDTLKHEVHVSLEAKTLKPGVHAAVQTRAFAFPQPSAFWSFRYRIHLKLSN